MEKLTAALVDGGSASKFKLRGQKKKKKFKSNNFFRLVKRGNVNKGNMKKKRKGIISIVGSIVIGKGIVAITLLH